MKDLLPYFEQELSFLRRHGREFAERYPKVASSLHLSGERSDDPHIERLIESFALLSARVSKRLEDGYPDFVESIFNVIYPHYLRPFPSCSIAQFVDSDSVADGAETDRIPRGTTLKTHPVNGLPCFFRTAWDVQSPLVDILEFSFNTQPRLAPQLHQASSAPSVLTLKLARRKGSRGAAVNFGALRVFIDAEASVCAALGDAIFLSTEGIYLEEGDAWKPVDSEFVRPVGFHADEALIDFPANSHQGYRLLTEYFAFPEKFNFFDLCLERLPPSSAQHEVLTLHLLLRGIVENSAASSLLNGITAKTLRLGCVPVVNLFSKQGEPIRLHGRSTHYPVVVDVRNPAAYEVSSIERVTLIQQAADGLQTSEIRPFFALSHGDSGSQKARFWMSSRNLLVAEKSPGYEMELTIAGEVEMDGHGSDVLSTVLSCTNRNLPMQLQPGQQGGDLFLEHGAFRGSIALLRRPSSSHRFDHRQEGLWRLVSHLSMNHLSLSGCGVGAIKALFSLYDLKKTASSRRQIEGIRAVENAPVTTWLSGRPFACFARGVEVKIRIDEDAFVGCSIAAFAGIAEAFFGLYAHVNSFVQLVLVSEQSGEELLRCKPCSGDMALA